MLDGRPPLSPEALADATVPATRADSR